MIERRIETGLKGEELLGRRETIAHLAQDRDEELRLIHICEKLETAQNRGIPAATGFLSKREQMLVSEILPDAALTFFSGAEQGERAVCVFLPEYLDESWLYSDDGPVAAVRATYFEQDSLSHRDFLGSLMGCGIRRDTVGDIFTGTGSCDFLVTRDILPYVLMNLVSAGRTKLHLEEIPLDQVRKPETKTKQIRDTVSSMRLDGIVSSGFSVSRAKAQAAIEAGKTELNYTQCLKPDRTVSQGDTVSVRGMGKIVLDEVVGNTRKGRIAIRITRFV